MKNLKELTDTKRELEARAKAVVGNKEVRSLDNKQVVELSEIRSQIQGINAEIAQEEEVRSKATTAHTASYNKENTKMDKKVEVRSIVDAFLRDQPDEVRSLEERAVQEGIKDAGTLNNGGLTVPDLVFNQIIEMLDNQSPAFQLAQKFSSVSGTLSIAREDDSRENKAGFVGELEDVKEIDTKLKSAQLTQKRVGAYIKLTQQLINDSGVDITNYAVNLLTKDVARAITNSIFLGKGGTEFNGVLNDPEVKAAAVKGESSVEGLLTIFNSLHQSYSANAVWIVSPAVYDQILKLQDGDNRYLALNTDATSNQDVFKYTFLGRPLYKEDALTGASQDLVFGDFSGYGIMVKKGMDLIKVDSDMTNALAGTLSFVLSGYMDGVVTNPTKFAIAKMSAPAASATVTPSK